MATIVMKQVNMFLRQRKVHRRWVALFLALACVVAYATLDRLKYDGQALNHKQMELRCTAHGLVAHEHNDDCYDEDGELRCPLPELELHEHDDSCYEEMAALVCDKLESDGHVHDASCYERVRDEEPSCGIENENHEHSDACYGWHEELICDIPEGEGAHHHGLGCYEIQMALACGLPEVTEEHVHDDDCFVEIDMTAEEVEELVAERDGAEIVEVPEKPALTGEWSADLLTAAESRIGETDLDQFIEWYGADANADAAFISWCLHTAEIPARAVTRFGEAGAWAKALQETELWHGLENDEPSEGDLLFLRLNEPEEGGEEVLPDHIAVFTGLGEVDEMRTFKVIEVWGDRVIAGEYPDDDPALVGFVAMPEAQEWKQAQLNSDLPAQTFVGEAGGVKVTVEADAGAFPADTTMVVTTVAAEDLPETVTEAVAGKVSGVEAVDIAFYNKDGEEIEPLIPIRVSMTAPRIAHAEQSQVVHVTADGEANLVEQTPTSQLDETPAEDQIVFDADGFSVYAIVYTVDFQYGVNGQTYELSLPGGGFIGFRALAGQLSIVGGSEDGTVTPEDAARQFVADIESVTFSSPELISVSFEEEETTVGAIKERLALISEFTAELTEEEIAEIDAQPVEAGDWALISLRPFDTEETLTVTMNDGAVFTIRVTDAQINNTDNIVDNGYYYIYTDSNSNSYALSSSGDAAQIDKNNPTLGNEYMWQFTKSGSNWIIRNVADPSVYLTLSNNSVIGSASTALTIANRTDSSAGFDIRHDVSYGYYGVSTYLRLNNGRTSYETNNSSGSRMRLLDAVPAAQQNKLVTLHFVDRDGNPLTGFTYNGQTIEGSTYDVTFDWAQEQGDIDLSDFVKTGYTLSNTHRATYEDLIDGVSPAGWHANAQQPHSIIGNELRWNSSQNTLQFREFYTNSDKAGSVWMNVGYRPTRWEYGEEIDTPVKDDIYDYYLVYDPITSGSGTGTGTTPITPPDLGGLGQTKELTSNYDGTYNLELGVTGKAASEKKDNDVNIIIVMDTSSSMTRNYKNEDQATNQNDQRLYLTKSALKTFVGEIAEFNTEANPDAVELAFITFNLAATDQPLDNDAGEEQYWSTESSDFDRVINGVGTHTGTNWAGALELADQRMLAHNDGDPTFVLFVTDGAPSQYWHSLDPGEDPGEFFVAGEGCYLAARDEARELVRDGAVLYGVFAYGPDADYENDYLGDLVEYAYNDDVRETFRFKVEKSQQGLENTLKGILKSISTQFGFADVAINDGITELTTVTFEDADPESFQYTITYRDYTSTTAYTVKTVDIEVDEDDGTITIPSVTYHTVRDGALKTITTEEVTIKGAEFTSSPNKKVTWTLIQSDGTPYLLEDKWTYQVKFKIWPSQPTYDLIAALNNGFLEWGTDYTYLDEDGEQQTIPAEDYMDQITRSGSLFTLKTNTEAKVTYKPVTEETVGDETTYVYGDEITVDLPEVAGMPLDNTWITMEKVWQSTLSQEDKPSAVDLYILEDPTPEKIAAFTAAYEALKADNTPEKLAAFEATYYDKVSLSEDGGWKADLSIAPGIYDQYGKLKTTGHTYMVMEPDIDGHYELDATPTHPMLNGLTHDADDPDTLLDMIDIYSEDGEIPEHPPTLDMDNQQSKISVTNILKAGINIRKELVLDDVPAAQQSYLNTDEYFTVRVTLKDAEGQPVVTPNNQEGGGALGYRIYASPDFPEGAVGTPGVGYVLNGLTYSAQLTDGVVTGYQARGPIYESSNGVMEFKIRASDTLRIVNVPMGTWYTVEEIVADTPDYKYVETEWQVIEDGEAIDDAIVYTNEITEEIHPDAENNVVVRNTPLTPAAELDFWKTGAGNTGLPGAVFQLLAMNTGGTYVAVAELDGYEGILLDGAALQTVTVGDTALVSAFTTTEAVQHFTALPIGSYKLVEHKAPDGYTITLREIEFTVTMEGVSVLTEHSLITFAAAEGNAPAQITVSNLPGQELPMTGGMGVWRLMALGLLLTLGAGAALMRRRDERP